MAGAARTHPAHAWRPQSCTLPRKSRKRLWGVEDVLPKNAEAAEGPGRNASSSAAASRQAAARGSGMRPQPRRAMRLPQPRPFRLRSGRPRGGAGRGASDLRKPNHLPPRRAARGSHRPLSVPLFLALPLFSETSHSQRPGHTRILRVHPQIYRGPPDTKATDSVYLFFLEGGER